MALWRRHAHPPSGARQQDLTQRKGVREREGDGGWERAILVVFEGLVVTSSDRLARSGLRFSTQPPGLAIRRAIRLAIRLGRAAAEFVFFFASYY